MSDQTAATWAAALLTSEGFTPLADLQPSRYFTVTGFAIEDTDNPGVARMTVTAVSPASRDQYEHWGNAQAFASRLLNILERHGAGFEEMRGREPNCAFDVYAPFYEAADKENTDA